MSDDKEIIKLIIELVDVLKQCDTERFDDGVIEHDHIAFCDGDVKTITDIGEKFSELLENTDKCKHTSTFVLTDVNVLTTGEAVEVCNCCGMSRSLWEQGHSQWCDVNLAKVVPLTTDRIKYLETVQDITNLVCTAVKKDVTSL